VTGAGLAAAGALVAKVAVVVIATGALAGTAGLVANRDSVPHAYGRTTSPSASRGVAGDSGASLIADEGAAGKGHQPSTVGSSRGTHGAEAALGAPRHGGKSPSESPGKSPGKTSRGVGKDLGSGAASSGTARSGAARSRAARSRAEGAQGERGSASGSTASAAGRPSGSSSTGKPVDPGTATAHRAHARGDEFEHT